MLETFVTHDNLASGKRKVSGSEPSGLGTQGNYPGRADPSEDSGTEARVMPPPRGVVGPSRLCSEKGGGAALSGGLEHQSEDGEARPGVVSAPPSVGDGEASDHAQSVPVCIGRRVDALVVAFRVHLSGEARDALRTAVGLAVEHGRSEMRLPIPGKLGTSEHEFCVAAIERPKGERVTFGNGDLRGCFIEALSDEEPGWSLELVARAVYLARHSLRDVVDELRTWAKAFGMVHEERLRRVDLCADFEGFEIHAEDGEAMVRPPRSTMTSWVDGRKPGEVWHKTYRMAGQRVTGHTVCPGNPLMLRVYDKSQELNVHRDPVKEQVERVIWKENGWQGGKVTRVEFQVRGEAAKELLGRSVDRLLRERDALWRYCCQKWVRLVIPDEATRLRRCPLDARWEAVQAVAWGERQVPLVRVRERGMATAMQAWGTMLTALGQAERLPKSVLDGSDELCMAAMRSETHARGALGNMVDDALGAFAGLIDEALLARFEGSASEAVGYVVCRMLAARARATEEGRHGEQATDEGAQHPVESEPPGAGSERMGTRGDAVCGAGHPSTRAETGRDDCSATGDGGVVLGAAGTAPPSGREILAAVHARREREGPRLPGVRR